MDKEAKEGRYVLVTIHADPNRGAYVVLPVTQTIFSQGGKAEGETCNIFFQKIYIYKQNKKKVVRINGGQTDTN